jgi:hypothetical protein
MSWQRPDVNYHDEGEQVPQTADWTCSACSLAWMNRALGIDVANDEWSAVSYIGTTANINAMYGLMDASGARLRECLREQGAPSFICWPSWSQLYAFAEHDAVLIGGVGWNHWVACRYVEVPGESHDNAICIANSAPGWMGVSDWLREEDFYRLGPFAAVVVPLYRAFPQ